MHKQQVQAIVSTARLELINLQSKKNVASIAQQDFLVNLVQHYV
jgi:hypothetical protein